LLRWLAGEAPASLLLLFSLPLLLGSFALLLNPRLSLLECLACCSALENPPSDFAQSLDPCAPLRIGRLCASETGCQ
jgi:hypothetical protein